MNITVTVVLIVLFVLMLIMPYFSQKKRNQEYMDMLSNVKVGDMVKTGGGIIGKVNKITDKGEIKTFILETGSKTNKSYLELDMTMIYCVLNKSTKQNQESKDENAEIVEESKDEAIETAESVEVKETKNTKKPKTTKTSTKSKTKSE